MIRTDQVFVVGSSRSGTTMIGRMLNNHSQIFTFKELHFFGKLWRSTPVKKFNKNKALLLLSRFLCIQKQGIFNQKNIQKYNKQAIELLDKNNVNNPLDVYMLFLKSVTESNSCLISCEQTPNNVYYLKEILDFFPNARVINMVRDQRDVLLSQKNKWKRKFLGASKIPFFESFRSYINYHPILTSKIWNSSLSNTLNFQNHDRVKIIKFEEIVLSPEEIMKEVCLFLNIEFQKNMLRVPLVGSSTQEDNQNKQFIDNSKIEKWKKGGLRDSEIYLSQLVSHKNMQQFSYVLKRFDRPPLFSLFYFITFPVKFAIAFLLNVSRVKNLSETIKRYFK